MGRTMETKTTVRAPLAQIERALRDDIIDVLGGTEEPGGARRRFQAELTVELGGGTMVRQGVEVRAGRVQAEGDGLSMALSWEAERSHLFPSFDGTLRVVPEGSHHELILSGDYDVPLGLLGRIGDVAAGRRVAGSSLQQLVDQIGRRLDEVIDAHQPAAGLRPAPPVSLDLRDRAEHPGSDLYIG